MEVSIFSFFIFFLFTIKYILLSFQIKQHKIDEKFFEAGLGTNFDTGIPGDPQDLKDREEEYSHNRKPAYISKSNLVLC